MRLWLYCWGIAVGREGMRMPKSSGERKERAAGQLLCESRGRVLWSISGWSLSIQRSPFKWPSGIDRQAGLESSSCNGVQERREMTRENWDVQEKEERRSIRRQGRATMINRIQRRKEGEMQQKEAGDSTCATRQKTRQKYMSHSGPTL